jgi:ATP-dependent Lon protease
LPIGGVKEKTIAAARAGIKKVILPARNRRDLDDIPQSTRALLEFVWVERVQEALEVALGEPAGSIDKVADRSAAAKASKNGQAEKSAA